MQTLLLYGARADVPRGSSPAAQERFTAYPYLELAGALEGGHSISAAHSAGGALAAAMAVAPLPAATAAAVRGAQYGNLCGYLAEGWPKAAPAVFADAGGATGFDPRACAEWSDGLLLSGLQATTAAFLAAAREVADRRLRARVTNASAGAGLLVSAAAYNYSAALAECALVPGLGPRCESFAAVAGGTAAGPGPDGTTAPPPLGPGAAATLLGLGGFAWGAGASGAGSGAVVGGCGGCGDASPAWLAAGGAATLDVALNASLSAVALVSGVPSSAVALPSPRPAAPGQGPVFASAAAAAGFAYSLPAELAGAGLGVGATVDGMAWLDQAAFYAAPALRALADGYASAGQDAADAFVAVLVPLAGLFLAAFVLLVNFVFLPNIAATNEDIHKKRAMLLFLPGRVIRTAPAIKDLVAEILAEGDDLAHDAGGAGAGAGAGASHSSSDY